MAKKRKPGFRNVKMLSGRCELDDYIRLEDVLYSQFGKKVNIQNTLNMFVKSCIAGSIRVSGSLFVGGC